MILHTKVIGKGESLVFLHTGLQTGELDFIPQQAHFEKNYKVILPDLRGHGQSKSEQVDVKSFFEDSAADLAETLEKLQIDQAHIVGASLGALVGLVFAKRYPEKTKSLALSGISPEKPANWNELQAEDLKMQRAIFTNEEAVRYFDNIHKSDWRTFLKQSQTLDWYPFQETGDLSGIQCPTLLIVGEGMKHEVKGVLQYPKMNNLFHVAVLPFASHLVHSEQPELYSLIVEQFLRRTKNDNRN